MLEAHVSRFDVELVRRYYERHTHAFVSFGQGGALGALHRAVWAPGVRSRTEAFRHVEDLIAAVLARVHERRDRPHVVDLGCGVGGSLCFLAGRLPVTGVGITLSPAQAAMATERVRAAGLADRLTVVAADYGDIPDAVGRADLAFAIESFVHAPDPERFFAECRRLVRPGGALVICDDFRHETPPARAAATIERFCRGWHINTLILPSELRALAARGGFVHDSTTDLSPYVEIGRWRDRVADAVAPLIERLPWRWSHLDPWLGGSALQKCLRNGWVGYDFIVFRRGEG